MSTSPPISITPAQPPATDRLPTLHDFFAPGGILSQSSLAFEHRRAFDVVKRLRGIIVLAAICFDDEACWM